MYRIKEVKKDLVTFEAVTLTSSPKDIIINGKIVKVTQVGTFIKEGQEIPQYAPNAYCIITMTKKDFDLMVNDITENTGEIQKLGMWIEQVKEISKKISKEWVNKPAYDYTNYLKLSVEPFYNKFLNKKNDSIEKIKFEDE